MIQYGDDEPGAGSREFTWLRFSTPELEQAYLSSRPVSVGITDAFVALGVLLILLLAVLAGEGLRLDWPPMDGLLAGLALLGLPAVMFLAWMSRGRGAYYWLPVLLHGVTVASLCMVTLAALPGPLPWAYELTLLYLLGLHSLIRLDCRQTGALGLLAMLVLVSAGWSLELPTDLLLRPVLVLTAGAALCVLASYREEYRQRRAWRQSWRWQELAERDGLTGLHNRRVFFERAQRTLAQARREQCPLGLLLFDVDHFKRYNDEHGHLAGDLALRMVAAVLAKAAQRPLDVCARLGGEEFGLLLFNLQSLSALRIADRLRTEVAARSADPRADHHPLTISVGVAVLVPQPEETAESLYARADCALYDAKHAGRNTVRHDRAGLSADWVRSSPS